ncbi:class I SAM-dependent methyltransferase [Chamaesiphon minutus]|uniref:Methyltransferase family protein n=1 Tax=Chamaesiphon minutus (strain ATCC 27169 / PCC 6605) TaxID=1173020 RepID=K9UQ47_CHAP6|nr:methyltransferase domain-containing protein [Chamaesiphon minutus]AFY96788.1 methyltransferase family protein [Chamaesiphon minutus PCC 6605]
MDRERLNFVEDIIMSMLLNIGCGTVYHKKWVNIDLNSNSSDVIQHDLSKGLPFESNSFDACYSSHVLEHLRKLEADFFIKEQKRILRKDGIVRIVVPDLETICRNYIRYLDELVSGDLSHEFRYDYSLLELYDQTTRDNPGGELLKLWSSQNITDLDYVVARHGKEALDHIQKVSSDNISSYKMRLMKLLTNLREVRKASIKMRSKLAELSVSFFAGEKMALSFRNGAFRDSGEIHRVMYDRYSLQRLLSNHGFIKIAICQPTQSSILDFNQYQLDSFEGKTRKPDSLFIEAVKA